MSDMNKEELLDELSKLESEWWLEGLAQLKKIVEQHFEQQEKPMVGGVKELLNEFVPIIVNACDQFKFNDSDTLLKHRLEEFFVRRKLLSQSKKVSGEKEKSALDWAEDLIEEILPRISCEHDVSKDEDGEYHSVTYDIDETGKTKIEVMLIMYRSAFMESFLMDFLKAKESRKEGCGKPC